MPVSLPSCLLPRAGHRLVVPHEEFGVFLEDLFRNFASHSDDGGVVALLPRLLETSADGLQAEDLEAPSLTYSSNPFSSLFQFLLLFPNY